jgi:hypothetical protein
MDYGMIGKIEKAKRYADEREERVRFVSFSVTIQGEHSAHTVTHRQGQWDCDCSFFKSRGVCSHTMALEKILDGMIPVSVDTTEA